ncbi:MAG: virulence RhuM family protein [Treponema sp.]|nr:virulence RhuM family protein [Treponema sp.]
MDEKSVAEDFSVTAADGKNYKTRYYNLDAIIAVGYRVNSKKKQGELFEEDEK